MKEKDYKVSVLLDFYGETLTEKQREVVELYYNEDLSLAEIAEHAGISRQGVRDSIKRGEASLFEMEEKLHLAERFKGMQDTIDVIIQRARDIAEYNARYCMSGKIGEDAKAIVELAKGLYDGG